MGSAWEVMTVAWRYEMEEGREEEGRKLEMMRSSRNNGIERVRE